MNKQFKLKLISSILSGRQVPNDRKLFYSSGSRIIGDCLPGSRVSLFLLEWHCRVSNDKNLYSVAGSRQKMP
jgi:hypothetical protein